MDIVINLEKFYEFLNLPPDIMLTKIFWTVGWIPIAITFIWGGAMLWLFYIQKKWITAQGKILLAIDIPRGNMQSPKAVENIFAYLAGAHDTQDLYEKWWLGIIQLTFSLEIVSIDGYTQFMIRTAERFRNLVESAIYSQYPDAEITEVDDYTTGYPSIFPDEQYDIWGSEFIQVKKSFYPLKTFRDFEHPFGEPETQYKDPMAVLMDLMSSLKKGEQIWYQLIVKPIGVEWADEAEKEVKKVIGEKSSSDKNIADIIIETMVKWLDTFSEFIYKSGVETEKKTKEEEQRFLMMNLKPKQKKQIEAIQEKVGKVGFGFKLRFIYLAKKEVMNKPKAANGFVGYIKQFNTNDLNSLKPDTGPGGTATKIQYPIFFNSRLNARKRKIMSRYKDRDTGAGRTPGILNTEELASIWHFPVESVVKAPLMQKAPGRKAEPPSNLSFVKEGAQTSVPFEEKAAGSIPDIFTEEIKEWGEKELISEIGIKKGLPPKNLPVV